MREEVNYFRCPCNVKKECMSMLFVLYTSLLVMVTVCIPV